MIQRILQTGLSHDFGCGKVIVVTGVRQVGKTTLVQQLVKGAGRVLQLNCDNSDECMDLEGKTSTGQQ